MWYFVALIWFLMPFAALAAMSPKEILSNYTRAIVYLEIDDASGRMVNSGTGFIISPDGYVVTAAHLKVDPTQRMSAVIGQRYGTSYPLDFRDADKASDVALWQLTQSAVCQDAVTISTKRPSDFDPVVILGFPTKEGLTPSSVKIMNTTSQRGFYKADGLLQPGDSGGPVFNKDGQVIAIVEGGALPGTDNNDLVPISHAVFLINKWGVQAGIDRAVPSGDSCQMPALAPTEPGRMVPPPQPTNPRSETTAPPQARCEATRPQIDIRNVRENADNGKFVILFDYGKTTIPPIGIDNLRSFIMPYYRSHPGISVSVIGYADAAGAEEDQAISEKRANAVVNALIDLGVARDRIRAAGRGPCGLHVATLAGVREAQNRLVEIIFHY